MIVIRISELDEEPVDTATPIPGWTGGQVVRTRQTLISEGSSENFNSSVVTFKTGATPGVHKHTSEQILVITVGSGIVATETEEHEINVGDVVHVKAGENHWHGAKADSYMSHITITCP